MLSNFLVLVKATVLSELLQSVSLIFYYFYFFFNNPYADSIM